MTTDRNATMVVYGSLFGDMHPVVFISMMCSIYDYILKCYYCRLWEFIW